MEGKNGTGDSLSPATLSNYSSSLPTSSTVDTQSISPTSNVSQISGKDSKYQNDQGTRQRQPVIVNSPEKKWKVLNLQTGHVLEEMLQGFCTESLPDKIIYNGEAFKLRGAFDEFWSLFYSSKFTKGRNMKLPNIEALNNKYLHSIARIIKRGWKDAHYFPKKIAQPLLEFCIFNRYDINLVMVTPEMFCEYIDEKDEEKIKINSKLKQKVDEESLEVFQKYYPEHEITVSSEMEMACIKLVRYIMLESYKEVIECWISELVGLLDIEEFVFLTRPVEARPSNEYQMGERIAPHKVWDSFFYGWDEPMIDFYFQMLCNTWDQNCPFCNKMDVKDVKAFHILSKCKEALQTVFKDRHDSVVMKIEQEIILAIERNSGYFSGQNNWKRLIMYGNKWKKWPIELSKLPNNIHPHIVVYSECPKKKALIIEIAISWGTKISERKEQREKRYQDIKLDLEKYYGFKTSLVVIVLGNRGSFSPELYNLFEVFFGMEYENITKTMEEISRKILSVPYCYMMHLKQKFDTNI